MNFSIIIPTRNRIVLFEELMESLRRNTKHKDKIEILVMGQEDDPPTIEILPKWKKEYSDLNLRYWILPWTEKYCTEYRRFLSQKSVGKFICSNEDEHEYMTKDWDALLLKRFEEFLKDKPDGVLYGRVRDNNGDNQLKYSCCPILSKKALEILNYEFYDMRYYGWGADQNLFVLFTGMKNQRICYIQDVFIKHKSHHHRARAEDDTNRLVAELNNRHPMGALDDDITDTRRKKLDGFINGE